MPHPPLSRSTQLAQAFAALGCDHAGVKWDYSKPPNPNGQYVFTATWSDMTDRPPVKVVMRGHDPIRLMVLGGLEMVERLADERPDVAFPEVTFT